MAFQDKRGFRSDFPGAGRQHRYLRWGTLKPGEGGVRNYDVRSGQDGFYIGGWFGGGWFPGDIWWGEGDNT